MSLKITSGSQLKDPLETARRPTEIHSKIYRNPNKNPPDSTRRPTGIHPKINRNPPEDPLDSTRGPTKDYSDFPWKPIEDFRRKPLDLPGSTFIIAAGSPLGFPGGPLNL